MLLQCAIVEDVSIEAENLAQALQAAASGCCELRLRLFRNGDELLSCPIIADFDVIFLDICMPGTDGIETAARLRDRLPQLPLVFVTSSGDFVWQALRTHPFDYLLKPCTPAAIENLLRDLLRAACRGERELEVRRDRKTLCVPFRSIQYVLAQNHAVCVMTDDGEYRAAANFSQTQAQLCAEPRFLACNRGVVVNMDRVLRFGEDRIELLCGKSFPVRQRDKRRLFQEFTQYQFRRMRKEL